MLRSAAPRLGLAWLELLRNVRHASHPASASGVQMEVSFERAASAKQSAAGKMRAVFPPGR